MQSTTSISALDEKHLLLKSMVPGINIRRMTQFKYLVTKDMVRQRVMRKHRRFVSDSSVLEKSQTQEVIKVRDVREMLNQTHAANVKLPSIVSSKLPIDQLLNHRASAAAIWPRKLNDVRKGFLHFDKIRRSSDVSSEQLYKQ